MKKIICSLFILGFLFFAHTAKANDQIIIEKPFAWETSRPVKTSAVYFTLRNNMPSDLVLIGATTPVAETVEMDIIENVDGKMQMVKQEAMTVPANGALLLAPGVQHLMLRHLKSPLKLGQSFPLTLTFENAAPITVTVIVKQIGGEDE